MVASTLACGMATV